MKRVTKHTPRSGNPKVAAVFAGYPAAVRAKLMTLRQMILDTAEKTIGVGPLEETLKWGQPSYLTTESGSGSTIRIDRVKSNDAYVAMYFHCQTDLVATFRELYPEDMEYGGNRSILFQTASSIPKEALRHCIGLALTYRARKNASKAASGKMRASKKPALRRREQPS